MAKDDQLLEYEEKVGFLKATAEELVDPNAQLSTQVGEARQEAALVKSELVAAQQEAEAAKEATRTAKNKAQLAEDALVIAMDGAQDISL